MDSAGLQHDEWNRQTLTESGHQVEDGRGYLSPCRRREPKEHHAGTSLAAGVDKLPQVLVFR